jgi:L-aspartate oxidase
VTGIGANGIGAPGWRRGADVVVVGSGAAGISAALTGAAAGLRVILVTKDLIGGATALAQGGLAAAVGPKDSAASHVGDTLTAGAGLCEPEVVAALAAGAPGAIDWLGGVGDQLETRDLRLEGGHSHRRIVHSGDDATGAEVHRVLLAALLASGIEILDRTVALDLIVGPAGVAGVTGLAAGVIGPDGRLSAGVIDAPTVVIAAGGLGQAFATTSNPAGATGDGIAIAARAGAVLRDLEFVQFHPTVLWLSEASGQCPLITEALRGAGAVLRDLGGMPLMAGHHPRGDLAPRDVVAARMAEVIGAADVGHGWLDATGIGADTLETGFPTVLAACRKHGIDPVTEFIPVAPGAHYSCGGILADLDGRTSIAGLYAVGEAASTGVQGANRLASNSVTEAIIAGRRAGRVIAGHGVGVIAGRGIAGRGVDGRGVDGRGVDGHGVDGRLSLRRETVNDIVNSYRDGDGRLELAAAMSRWAGVIRDREGLTELGRVISALGGGVAGGEGVATGAEIVGGVGEAASVPFPDFGVDLGLDLGFDLGFDLGSELSLGAVEAANLRVVSGLIATGALRRAESRGCHRRRDAVGTAERAWHTLMRWDGRELVADGG